MIVYNALCEGFWSSSSKCYKKLVRTEEKQGIIHSLITGRLRILNQFHPCGILPVSSRRDGGGRHRDPSPTAESPPAAPSPAS